MAGPSLASGLIGLLGGPLTVGATSVYMALSSLFVSRIRHREDTPSAAGRPRLVAEIRGGLAFVLGHPILRRIILCTGMANCASAAASALLVLHALGALGLSPFQLSLVMGRALGGVLGALSAGWAQRVLGEGRAIAVAADLAGAAPLLLPAASWLPPLPTMVAAWSAMSWAAVLSNVTLVSFRQRLCPKPLLGRMNASIRFLVWGPMPLGGLAAGLLGHACGLVPTLWIFAAVAVCSALPVLLSPLASMAPCPQRWTRWTGTEAHRRTRGDSPRCARSSPPAGSTGPPVRGAPTAACTIAPIPAPSASRLSGKQTAGMTVPNTP